MIIDSVRTGMMYMYVCVLTQAASRHRCGVLVRVLLKDFQDQQGDSSWLRGIDHLPRKLQNLLEVNKLLAHRPWLVNHKHMEMLLQPGPDSWSMGELMHALVLLAHWHAVSGFVFGCGVNPELDMPEGHSFTCTSQSTGDRHGAASRSEQPTSAPAASSANGSNGVHSSGGAAAAAGGGGGPKFPDSS
eukprot:scpid87075/ scgid0586/ Sestrin-1; XPA26; p53-regulated protein PA26